MRISSAFNTDANPLGPKHAAVSRSSNTAGTALGLRNLTHYITRSLLETGRFRTQLHLRLRLAPLRDRLANPGQEWPRPKEMPCRW